MAGIYQDTSRLTTREREAVYRCYREFFRDSADIPASFSVLKFQIPPSTVQRILKKKEEGLSVQPGVSSGRKPIPHDYTFKETLNDLIFSKIKSNEYISLDIIFELAKEHLDFDQSKSTLHRIVKKLVTSTRKLIVENSY